MSNVSFRTIIATAMLSASVFATGVYADDTEIFFAQSDDAVNTNPNILFVLDTSVSMLQRDGTSTSRLDKMKSAMRGLLQQSSGFNVGIMDFLGADRGGAIRYPISDLDGNTADLCGDSDCPDQTVIAKPNSSDGDATENNDTLAVTLDSDMLVMPRVAPVSNPDAVISDVTEGTAYAAEIVAEFDDTPRAITTTSRWFYNGTPDVRGDLYAYRFEGIEIPVGATVTSAYLAFTETARSAQTGDLSTSIRLEYSANPEPLPNDINGADLIRTRLVRATDSVQWSNVHPDTSGLSTTTAVDSDPLDITAVPVSTLAGDKAYSPDLSEIVNDIVTLPTWVPGNAMTFLFDPADEYVPSEADIREFYGLDADVDKQPVLHFTYTTEVDTSSTTTTYTAQAHSDEITTRTGDATTEVPVVSRNQNSPVSRLFYATELHASRELAFRFENIDIPPNAIIEGASITIYGADASAIEAPITDWINTDDGSLSAVAEPEPTDGDTASVSDDTPPLGSALDRDDLTIHVRIENTSTPEAYEARVLADREHREEFLNWDNFDLVAGESLNNPRFEDILQEFINEGNWSEGGDLSLLFSAPETYNNVLSNSGLIDTTTGVNPPSISITWRLPEIIDETTKGTQTTAIRFDQVFVPPNARITSAHLEFTAARANIGKTNLQISAEEIGSPSIISDEANNISSRESLQAKINWEVEPWELPGETYQSPPITTIVQDIVSQGDWCSGNAITIFLDDFDELGSESEDSRTAVAHDDNPAASPSLVISYDINDLPQGEFCSNATTLLSIDEGRDDGNGNSGDNVQSITAATLDAFNGNVKQRIGTRFSSLPVPQGATITNARLILTTARNTNNRRVRFETSVSNEIDPPTFGGGNRSIFALTQNLSSAQQTWKNRNHRVNDQLSINVRDLVQGKVSSPNWAAGNPILFSTSTSFSNNESKAHAFHSFEAGESLAPQLIVSYQAQSEQAGTALRDELINTIDNFRTTWGTPIVSSLYEAALYFNGDAVDFGKKRGRRLDEHRWSRVAHPLSYDGGEVFLPAGCTEDNPTSTACIGEEIRASTTTPFYKSPITGECQQTHMVLLTDGAPWDSTRLHQTKVKNYTGITHCANQESNVRRPRSGACGPELAEWLLEDQNPYLPGVQGVKTHAVAFNLNNESYLKSITDATNGELTRASTSAELLGAFKQILNSVNKTDSTFVAPSATLSQANRLKNRDDLYFALFKPETTTRWNGNLKRFTLAGESTDDADILDANGNPAVNMDTGEFNASSQSYWSTVVDGNDVTQGGAAEQMQQDGATHLDRNVYTTAGVNRDLSHNGVNELLPTNPNINKEWLQLPATLENDTDYITDLLNWAHGQDIDDIDGDGNTDEARDSMGDPLHSQPVIVNYTGDRSAVYVATNEGFLHSIDHVTGAENFAFIPRELLKNLRSYYENQQTNNRPYGLDGAITVWIDDANNDGIVDPAEDTAYLYVGMRRGGNSYFALDITNPDEPYYLWDIAGGAITSNADLTQANGDFTELGQTWSKPIKARMYFDDEEHDVLVFGAGYATNQDAFDTIASVDSTVDNRQTRSKDSVGRGFFIVDARTGEHIYNTDRIKFPFLDYSVPSDLRVVDINFDGLADQIYFGDMGGQVFRFDFNNDKTFSGGLEARLEGDRVAVFAEDDSPEDARRFYYPPDVSLVNIDGAQQVAISIGSGWRAHPLDTDVDDRFYSFRMTQVFGAPRDQDGSVLYPVEITERTRGMIDLSGDSLTGRRVTNTERGWFLPLRSGEKVLSSSLTLDNTLLFSTYIPSIQVDGCSAAIGSGSAYLVDLASGNPVRDLDHSDEDDTITDSDTPLSELDRFRPLRAPGIPTVPTVLFPEIGDVTVLIGRETINEISLDELKERTYWREHATNDDL